MVKIKTLGRQFKQFDFFSKSIALRVNGSDSFGSIFGACTSLIIALVLAAYGVNKFLIMWNYEDTNFNEFPV